MLDSQRDKDKSTKIEKQQLVRSEEIPDTADRSGQIGTWDWPLDLVTWRSSVASKSSKRVVSRECQGVSL